MLLTSPKAVLASSTVSIYFPVVDGRYVDGGVGSSSNPCDIAAYEAAYVLPDCPLTETTLISVDTGSTKTELKEGEVSTFSGTGSNQYWMLLP